MMRLKNALIALSLFAAPLAQASDCTVAQPKQLIPLTSKLKSNLKNPVDVQFRLDGNMLIADFEVRTPTINAKKVLGPNEYPYQADVVELFLSVNGNPDNLPYFEFELSPYNNTFEVRVDSFKKPFIEGLNLGFEHRVVMTQTGWKGRMAIPLKNLGWDGDPKLLVGNAFAILGKTGSRNFYSLSLPFQEKPSFHKPQFFKPLLKCKN